MTIVQLIVVLGSLYYVFIRNKEKVPCFVIILWIIVCVQTSVLATTQGLWAWSATPYEDPVARVEYQFAILTDILMQRVRYQLASVYIGSALRLFFIMHKERNLKAEKRRNLEITSLNFVIFVLFFVLVIIFYHSELRLPNEGLPLVYYLDVLTSCLSGLFMIAASWIFWKQLMLLNSEHFQLNTRLMICSCAIYGAFICIYWGSAVSNSLNYSAEFQDMKCHALVASFVFDFF